MTDSHEHDPLHGTSVPSQGADAGTPGTDRGPGAAGGDDYDPGAPTTVGETLRVPPPAGGGTAGWQGAWPNTPPPPFGHGDPAQAAEGGAGLPPRPGAGSWEPPPPGSGPGHGGGFASAGGPPSGQDPGGASSGGHDGGAMGPGGGAFGAPGAGGAGYGGHGPGGPGHYGGGFSDPYGWPHDPRGPWGPSPAGHWQQPAGYWAPPGHRPRGHFGAGLVAALAAAVFVVAGLAGLGVGRAVWHHSSSSSATGGTGGTTIPMYPGQNSGGSGGGPGSGSNGFGSNPFGSNGGTGGTNPGGYPGFGGNPGSGSNGFGSGNNSTGAGAPANTSAIAAKVSPGLVDVNTELGYQDAEAAGTGIVLSSSGLILTNNHVISGATKISVYDIGNGKTYGATVVGYDRTDDIAVLQAANASKLQTANIGTSATLAVGQAIVGIGNAGGTGGVPSYAGGSITALNQSITASDDSTGTSEQLTGLIQTNADIQPGDSGGALVNANGQVIGVDTAASSGFSFNQQGAQGFAIPIDKAMSITTQIRGSKASTTVHIGATPFLGVGLANSGGQSGSTTYGTRVGQVIPGTPAQKAGIVAGDTINSIGGVSVSTGNDLTTAIDEHHPGDKVAITWTDTSGATHSAQVTLAVGPAN